MRCVDDLPRLCQILTTGCYVFVVMVTEIQRWFAKTSVAVLARWLHGLQCCFSLSRELFGVCFYSCQGYPLFDQRFADEVGDPTDLSRDHFRDLCRICKELSENRLLVKNGTSQCLSHGMFESPPGKSTRCLFRSFSAGAYCLEWDWSLPLFL